MLRYIYSADAFVEAIFKFRSESGVSHQLGLRASLKGPTVKRLLSRA